MASKHLAKTLKRSSLALALGMCFVGGAYAQSNAAGAITGRADPGDVLTITNPATGFSRTVTVGADGNYRFSALPTGQYQISENGGEPRAVRVNVGVAANVDFTGDATTLGTVTVIGSNTINPIDVSSVESTTILTAEQVARIPVARNATNVALLAPGTVRGDAAFGNLASFGGSSVAENQYYLNGFNITNTYKNLAFAQMPYEAIAEQQVKTGGYGAEFGRSTGGVINMISKSGTNEFHAGGNIFWAPESLSETNPNQYYNNGDIAAVNSKDNSWSANAAIWASGALVQDKLFAYGLVQYSRSGADGYPGASANAEGFGGTNSHQTSKAPMWLLKMDWNISQDHTLALTAFSDNRDYETEVYRTRIADDGTPTRDQYLGTRFGESGGESYSLKYTGYLTDSFTLSVLAGHGEFSRADYAVQANGEEIRYNGDLNSEIGGCGPIGDSRSLAVRNADPLGAIVSDCYFAGTITRADAKDQRDQYRIDAEWQLGDHLIRGGLDIDNFETVDGSAYAGGYYYIYYGGSIADPTPSYALRYNIRQGATVQVNQRAYYLEDSWSVTDNFMLYGGVRWDTFENKNGDGEAYVKIDNQFSPRLGFSWDVNGDGTFKVFGNAGRYALPLTSNVAIRGASRSLYEYTYVLFDGIDRDSGRPINPVQYPGNGPYYANGETGGYKDPVAIAATNLKPMYQDEYILGFQKQMSENISFGVRGIYRDLKRAIDDICDVRPIYQWAYDHGLSPYPGTPAFPYCRLYNPGQDGIWTVDVDADGTLETVVIPKDEVWEEGNAFNITPGTLKMGPESKRTYSALEFFFQGNWDKLFLQGSYTYSRSRGNTEGGVKSDIGQDDTGTTQDFDYPELMIGAYGDLPNDRRHSLKLFGSYDLTDEWRVGANLLIQSGRPLNCFGIYGNDPAGYRNSYFSCDSGDLVDQADIPPGEDDHAWYSSGSPSRYNGRTIVSRGSAGRTPWTTSLDLNLAYAPNWAEGLKFKVDVFNVFNKRKPVALNEDGENSVGDPVPAADTYLMPIDWQQPRYVRFMVQYDF